MVSDQSIEMLPSRTNEQSILNYANRTKCASSHTKSQTKQFPPLRLAVSPIQSSSSIVGGVVTLDEDEISTRRARQRTRMRRRVKEWWESAGSVDADVGCGSESKVALPCHNEAPTVVKALPRSETLVLNRDQTEPAMPGILTLLLDMISGKATTTLKQPFGEMRSNHRVVRCG